MLYAEQLAREESIPGFEDSSDGESSNSEMEDESSTTLTSHRKKIIKENGSSIDHSNILTNQTKIVSSSSSTVHQNSEDLPLGYFKWNLGIKAFNTWLANKIERTKLESIKQKTMFPVLPARQPNDLLKLKNGELNSYLVEFVNEVRKPNGEIYAPESIYYICLGIQFYLQEKGARNENIFLDFSLFDEFQEAFNKIALRYNIRIDAEGQIISKIEEEILWESKQLGAHSPFVLLITILYFNTKYFFLGKVEAHKKLSFNNVKKHAKRNIGPDGTDYGKSNYLRYYPDFHGMEQVIYEQGENYENPLRCPIELYNFYLSKWSVIPFLVFFQMFFLIRKI